MINAGVGAAAAPRACLGYGCRRGAGAGAARGRGGGRGTLIFASRWAARIRRCRARGGDLDVGVRAQRLGLVPDGVPPVSAAPGAEIRWLVLALPKSLCCAPTPNPALCESPREHGATAPGSHRRAAAWRTRTRHPNFLKLYLYEFANWGSRAVSCAYKTSSDGPRMG